MYTIKEIMEASPRARLMAKQGQVTNGVLTAKEAEERAKGAGTVITQSSSKRKVFFFTDDHIFGYPVIPNDFVSCTSQFPMQVEPRAELPTGLITSIDEYITIFEHGRTQLTSIEELVNLLNSEK